MCVSSLEFVFGAAISYEENRVGLHRQTTHLFRFGSVTCCVELCDHFPCMDGARNDFMTFVSVPRSIRGFWTVLDPSKSFLRCSDIAGRICVPLTL